DFAANRMPTVLDGVSVTVNGKSAFVYYVSSSQLNILTPPDPLPASVEVKVNNGGGSSVATGQGAALAPAFFVLDGTDVTASHADGTLLGPAALYPGFSTPARPGETVTVYANGLGPVSEPIVSGSPQQSGVLPVLPVIRIGNAPARVSFAGL